MSTVNYESVKIALAIKASRTLLGMSLKDVASHCGVSAVTVGKWEANELPLKVIMFLKLIKFFNQHGVSFDIDSETLNISMSHEGLEKQVNFFEHKAKLKNSSTEAVNAEEGAFAVNPVINRRRKRNEVEPE